MKDIQNSRIKLLDTFINRILCVMVGENYIDEEEMDIYRFGLECMVLKVIHYISYIIIAIFMKSVIAMIFSSIILVPLRCMAGGYHAKTRIRCYLFSCAVVAFLCKLNQVPVSMNISIIILLIADVIILAFAPVENENRPIDMDEKIIFVYKTRLILFIGNIAIIITVLLKLGIHGYMINGILVVALMLLLGKMKIKMS